MFLCLADRLVTYRMLLLSNLSSSTLISNVNLGKREIFSCFLVGPQNTSIRLLDIYCSRPLAATWLCCSTLLDLFPSSLFFVTKFVANLQTPPQGLCSSYVHTFAWKDNTKLKGIWFVPLKTAGAVANTFSKADQSCVAVLVLDVHSNIAFE